METVASHPVENLREVLDLNRTLLILCFSGLMFPPQSVYLENRMRSLFYSFIEQRALDN